ncbi:MAG: hypothetical protein AAF611_02605 [Bacteroidota bacterium]
MLKNISYLGKELSKKEQASINGGIGVFYACYQRIQRCSPNLVGWAVDNGKNGIGCCQL